MLSEKIAEMDEGRPECAIDHASMFSRIFFLWTGKLINVGNSKTLEDKDIPLVANYVKAQQLVERLACYYAKEEKTPYALHKAVFKAFFSEFWWGGLILIIEIPLNVWQAYLLGYLISYFFGVEGSANPMYNNGYILSLLLTVSAMVYLLMHHHYFFDGMRFGLQLRIALSGTIYNKAVRLNLRSLTKAASGNIVSLTSQDVEVLIWAGLWLHFLYAPVVQGIVVLYFGIKTVGYSFLAGFVAVLLLIPLQGLFASIISKNRKVTASYTDQRIKLVNQALVGVRIMKMNGWEWAFRDLIQQVRTKEVNSLMRTNYLKAINEAIFFSAPSIVACIVWVLFARGGGHLTPMKLFVILQLLQLVQFGLAKFFSMAIMFCSEGFVSLKRIKALLDLDEVEETEGSDEIDAAYVDHSLHITRTNTKANKYTRLHSDVADGVGTDNVDVVSTGDIELSEAMPAADAETEMETKLVENVVISCKHLYATWDGGVDVNIGSPELQSEMSSIVASTAEGDDFFALRDVSYEIKENELVVVIGAVGSSKSSLLMSLLGELSPTSGKLQMKKEDFDLSFCAQEPFIMSNTIRNNILFGRAMDQEWYDEVANACALTPDFQLLTHGDETIIGDRGINLSGGQRARVGLARIVYSKSQLNLLDDPLSAVDPNVGSQLFNNVICGVLKNSTRILVTHQTQYLSSPHVSRIMILHHGKIVAFDTYKNLKSGSGEYSQWLDIVEASERKRRASSAVSVESAQSGRSRSNSHCTAMDESVAAPAHIATNIGLDVEEIPEDTKDPAKNVTEGIIAMEDKASGGVGWDTYKNYSNYVGTWPILALGVLLMIIGQIMVMTVNVWLAKWSKLSDSKQQSDFYSNVYITLVCCFVIASLVRCGYVYRLTTLASIRMHDHMLGAVLRAPVSFFDANPIGRVLNRFSKDIGYNDNQIPEVLFDFSQVGLMVTGTIFVVSVGNFMILVILVPLIYLFLSARSYYMQTAREVKRIEALFRSPIFSHLSETLDGLVTIRAFKHASDFIKLNYSYLDRNTSAHFAFISCARWLGFVLDTMVVFLVFSCTMLAVAAKEYNAPITPAVLAVGVMYVMQLMGLFQWAVRQSTEIENLMVSVERIVSYSKLTPEPALLSSDFQYDMTDSSGIVKKVQAVAPPASWPEKGLIVAKNLVCTYRADLPPTIKDVSFTIQPGQRVGIVGRTGAGKSSLMSVLLRLIDVTSGSLCIDGVNIHHIGLHEVRPKISVIPQVPFLFLGTIRQNLDMFHEHSDADIWAAIDALNLRDAIIKKSRGENMVSPSTSPVKGGGSDLLSVVETASLVNPLDGDVAEGGGNFSMGERQLLCLCRAILQKNKILIMDEATANVDMDTDREIQRAIRKEFTDSTVLMIAHRLQTVIDCDVIIVLAAGKLVEIGHPHELLTNSSVLSGETGTPDNSFLGMVNDTGPVMSKQLHDLARLAFDASSSGYK